ncbi:MAG TPA: glycosyltransferase family 2 protein [Spirochaetota bacterium]|nr:glycosyltransferase family 2 protein [Spirochaetota bacterium]
MKNYKISVIIPCYNEELVIGKTYDRLVEVMQKNNYSDYEMVFIDDGSRDNTVKIIYDLSLKDSKVKILVLSRNFGKEAAVSCGINNCEGDLIFLIDADLQDPPELFPDMIELYEREDCDVVFGVRKERKGETFFKKFTSKMFYRVISYLSDINLPKDTADFKLINKKVADEFKRFGEKNKYVRGIISYIGFKQIPFYYDRDPRIAGDTKFSVKKLIKLALNGIFYFSKKPLKLATNIGFICIFFSLILMIYAIASKVLGISIFGWASMFITIVFFGGIQLFSIGLLGEYIANIFEEVKSRPEYIVSKKINVNDEYIPVKKRGIYDSTE